jgi:hypothetical protein
MLHQLKIILEQQTGNKVYFDVMTIRADKLRRLQERIRDGIFSIDSTHPREVPSD